MSGVDNPPGVLAEDEGTPIRRAGTLNFAGTGVTVTDPGDGTILVTISGGGGSTTPADVDAIDTLANRHLYGGNGTIAGFLFLTEDTGQIYRASGSGWVAFTPLGLDPGALRGQNWTAVLTQNPEAYPADPTVNFVTMEVPLAATGNQALAAVTVPGDDWPRWVMLADPGDAIFYMGDGTFDPIYGGGAQLGGSGGEVFANALRVGGDITGFGNMSLNSGVPGAALSLLAGPAAISLGESVVATPAPDGLVFFASVFVRDNGSGKAQLCVRFPTGAVQVIATEP